MSHTEEGGSKSKTFSNFVNCELVCFIFNVLNGGKIKVSGDATIFLVEKLNCLPGDVHHACKHSILSNTSGKTIMGPTKRFCALAGRTVCTLFKYCVTSRASGLSCPVCQRLKAPESVLPGQQGWEELESSGQDACLPTRTQDCGGV